MRNEHLIEMVSAVITVDPAVIDRDHYLADWRAAAEEPLPDDELVGGEG